MSQRDWTVYIVFTLVYSTLLLFIASWAMGADATLTWTDTSDAEEGFRIYRAPTITTTFELLAATGPNQTTYTDKLAQPGNCYRVSAFNSAGESQPSNNACLLVLVPIPPTLTLK